MELTLHLEKLNRTFKQPNEVVIDTDVLRTLSKREMKSGYAEIIKHAINKGF